MARPIRIEHPGGWYQVSARGNERRAIFRDERDRRHFCELLGEMVERFNLRWHAFVLMDNHYHLLLELREANLSRALPWLNVSYSIWFNRRQGRSGHLFQGRFKSVVVSPEEWGLELSRYLHLNPVRIGRLGLGKREQQRIRAGAAERPQSERVRERLAVLGRHRWSTYRAYIGLEKAPEWLECAEVLALGGGRAVERAGRYREYVEEAVREGLLKSPWEELTEQVVLGGEEFLKRLRGRVRGDQREQRAAGRLRSVRPVLGRVIECVEEIQGQKWEEFRDRRGDPGRERVWYLGRRVCGMKWEELARAVGLKEYASAAMAVRRYERRLRRDRNEKKYLEEVTEMLNVKM